MTPLEPFLSFTGKQTWTCEFCPKSTYYYFSKCGCIFLGIFPLENTVILYTVHCIMWKHIRSKVLLSQIPTFSPKREPRLSSLGCEPEKKPQTTQPWIDHFYQGKFSQNLVGFTFDCMQSRPLAFYRWSPFFKVLATSFH